MNQISLSQLVLGRMVRGQTPDARSSLVARDVAILAAADAYRDTDQMVRDCELALDQMSMDDPNGDIVEEWIGFAELRRSRALRELRSAAERT